MVLTPALLSAELVTIAEDHPPDVATAIVVWSTAYHNWMLNSVAAGAVPLNPVVAEAARVSMAGALVALAAGGPAALAAGVAAYWAGLNVPAAYGASTAVVPPPTLGTLAGVLTTVFLANTAAGLSIPDAQDAIAAAWVPTTLGGQATIGGSNVPIT